MPELPEVEVVRRGLVPLVGASIGAVSHVDSRVARRYGASDLAGLAGARVDAVVRRGKFLWLLVGDDGLLIHLGMSGQVLLNRPGAAPPRHLRARVSVGEWLLDFVDQRTFGALHRGPLQPTPDGLPGGVGSPAPVIPVTCASVARDVLDPHLDLDVVARRLAGSRRAIKAVLLDQSVVSGIGNIYADEGLFAAGVHPARPVGRLRSSTRIRVYEACAGVMRRALEEGGTSFDRLYVGVDGHPGYFQRRLAIYGRAGERCVACGAPVRRIVVAGRGTHVCLRCQRTRQRP